MSDIYRFDRFKLDARTGELRRNGQLLPLQPQPAAILSLLAERAGDLVTREEIQAAIWPDRTVD
jgi:DNA-binding winged helix-turn-helix (wHTH) protein